MHLGLEPGGPLHGRDHGIDVLLEDDLLERQIEALLLQPAKMCLRLPGLASVDPAMPQQEGPQSLSGLELERLHVLACTG